MAHDPINTGYAQALFEMARAESAVGRVEEELFRLRDLLKRTPDLLQFLKDPTVKREGKRQALAELFGGKVHPVVLNALIALSDQDRTSRILPIIEECLAISAASKQKISGEVTTAIALDEDLLKKLEAELSRVTGKNVQVFQKIDPSILGGAIIKVGEEVIDASLRRKLREIKERLVQ